jgi:diaminohydroxyphosphoribosylaminopyrimidine deaminase/5-amino-6-(5-phosphoribosylamino)uracil reductase
VRRETDNTVDRADAESAMRMALDLTRSTHPHPNPRVGAVIIDSHGIVRAAGAHVRPGTAHAEVLAIDGRRFDGDTMVVTLEPCVHTGRTEPCTEAIVAAGIARVVVGAIDPDPRVAGRGVERLRKAGIRVETGILAKDVEALDPGYFFHRRTGRALVTLKMATTLDGQAAAADGTSQWITGERARIDVHELRSRHDAVMVGSGTVIADAPRLSVRLDGYDGPQPRPVLIVGRRPVPDDAPLLERDPLIYREEHGVDLNFVLEDLPEHGILTVLAEGGPTVARSLMDKGLVDEIVWYLGGRLGGGLGTPAFDGTFPTMLDAFPITIRSVDQFDDDVRVTARLARE